MGIIVYDVIFVQLCGRQIGLILRSAGREQKSTCASSMWGILSLAWSAPVCFCLISLWSASHRICLLPKNIGSLILISHELRLIPYILLMVALCDCICGGATHWWRDLVYVIGVFESIQMTETHCLSVEHQCSIALDGTQDPFVLILAFIWIHFHDLFFFFFWSINLKPRTAF